MNKAPEIEVRIIRQIAEIGQANWDACANSGQERTDDPFTTYRFLKALEDSESVGTGTGWQPHYLQALEDGETIGVAPMYAKSHSQGEYIFDHNWAHAYERAGGRYYPKLQIAVPHTPATGRRILVKDGHEDVARLALMQGAVQVTGSNNFSSLHITFCTDDERAFGAKLGLLERASQQFHWLNNNYMDFDGFLSGLSSRKRKNIRKEREKAQNFGGEIHCLTGDQIQPEHWDAFWIFYQDTGARKWGTPYLTRAFFDHAQQHLRNDMLLVLAERDGQYVAGALNFIGRDILYGRYWGCVENHPCLHFEVCYYQAIDYAIKHRLSRVEAGAQGSHKLARGYMPVATNSLHWIADESFSTAIADYLQAERAAVDDEIEIMTTYGPFKKTQQEEQE